jgi:hypothetical protein
LQGPVLVTAASHLQHNNEINVRVGTFVIARDAPNTTTRLAVVRSKSTLRQTAGTHSASPHNALAVGHFERGASHHLAGEAPKHWAPFTDTREFAGLVSSVTVLAALAPSARSLAEELRPF